MVRIEINGTPIEAQDGAMVIEAADQAGIVIPRFCYHKKLSIAANCRMCLVEVEKVGKPLPACATPVTDGMKVYTRSPKALAAQRSVMEFLLINHPLDCPICDQGGECDLQEMAMGFGEDISRYQEGKRVVPDKNIGPLIATDMTRCIHCTRCVRFGQEIAGMWELGATGRGEHTRIGTYVEGTVDSELSGNVIDLCPVGALTSKPYRYTARPWELIAHESVSPHDCVGANLKVNVRGQRVMRVLPRENEAVNETWLADRDRYSYTALAAEGRLTAPMIKKNGKWVESDWDEALTYAAEGLQRVVQQHGAEQLGALGGYTATVEELYLLQRLVRGVGSGNIDHRLRQIDFRDQDAAPPFPWVGQPLADIETADAILLVGSNVRKEQPLIGLRVRKAGLAGADISVINPLDYDFVFPVASRLITPPAEMVAALAGVAKALTQLTGEAAPEGLDAVTAKYPVDEAHKRIAQSLHDGQRATVLLGNLAAYHPAQAELRALAALIARLAGARLGQLAEGGNSAGAWLAGAVPHRREGAQPASQAGRDWRTMFADGLKGYLLLGTEPEQDCIDSGAALAALAQAEFVVSLAAYADETTRDYADVLLPTALFPETGGTFVNGEGRWQSFAGCTPPPGEARPAWKILRVLGNLFDLPGFGYMSVDEVREEVRAACAHIEPSAEMPWRAPTAAAPAEGLMRIADFPIYATDAMVRRAEPLQQTADGRATAARIHPETARQNGVAEAAQVRVRQGGEATLALTLDERVPVGCVYIAAGQRETLGLGAGTLELEPA
jgi:NADH-quinone oxidoreductase subunit G